MAGTPPTGCVQGRVVLRIPLLDPTNPTAATTVPLDGVRVVVTARGAAPDASTKSKSYDQQEGLTGNGGHFCIEGIPAGERTVWYQSEITQPDGTTFVAIGDLSQNVEIPAGSACPVPGQTADLTATIECCTAATFEYAIDSLIQAGAVVESVKNIETATTGTATSVQQIATAAADAAESVGNISGTSASTANHVKAIRDAVVGTNTAVDGVRDVLKEMFKFPPPEPPGTGGDVRTTRGTRQPSGRTSAIRTGVASVLSDVGITNGNLTDADLARLFPATTDEDGEVSYSWAGPALATQTSSRLNGASHNGAVHLSGSLARFHQQAQAAMREVREALASIKPLDGATSDPRAIAAQKAIVIQTMQSIVDEPQRPGGLRQLAIDLHFTSLLEEEIPVEIDGATIKTEDGNLGVLKFLLGISNALINDQDAEIQVTEWRRVEDAITTTQSAWNTFKGNTELKLGERLQELHASFRAISEAVEDSRAMLRSVRFSPQEQAAKKFEYTNGTSQTGYGNGSHSLSQGASRASTDEILSMIQELAEQIGPTYINDWKGRSIATIGGRAAQLAKTVDQVIDNNTDTFPFDNERVTSTFDDIARLLEATSKICDAIRDDMRKSAENGAHATLLREMTSAV